MTKHFRFLLFPLIFLFGLSFQQAIAATNCSAVTEIPQTECEALVAFWNSTGGPNWSDAATNNWNVTNTPCSWTGVICSQQSPRNITDINRSQKNLIGTLPNINLPALQVLTLDNNQLGGSIPDFSNLPNLAGLNLPNNQLSGNIPNFNNLPKLRQLNLSSNKLSGSVPDFSNMPDINVLLLDYNQLSGSIPKFNNLPFLQQLYLHSNQLNGSIPDFSNLPVLKQLTLDENQLTGSIPDFSNMPVLQKLYLLDNQLSGTVPDFTNLPALLEFMADYNQLSGAIPDFKNLPNLQTLSLSNNQLEGSIPDFRNLLSLQKLNLGINQLSGNIPNFSNLSALETLGLYANQLSGNIPSFDNLSALQYLALNYNKLTGSIPSFSNFPVLQQLDLTGNHLTGNTPSPSIVLLLQNLSSFGVRNNCISPADASVVAVLDEKDPGWSFSQENCPVPNLAQTDCSSVTEIPTTECVALIDFWNSTDGLNWIDASTNNWNNTNTPCSWTGIFCESGHVIDISRYNQNLTGTLPDLSGLPYLKFLSLHSNQLTGSLLDLTKLPQLITLVLQDNQLSGEIGDLSFLKKLNFLNLDNNQFSGPVPNVNPTPEGGDGKWLAIHLSNNKLSGELPTSLANIQFSDLNSPALNLNNNECLTTSNTSLAEILTAQTPTWNETQACYSSLACSNPNSIAFNLTTEAKTPATACFTPSATTNTGKSGNPLAVTADETVTLATKIEPATEHVGQSSRLVVLFHYQHQGVEMWYARKADKIVRWYENWDNLPTAAVYDQLPVSLDVPLFTGALRGLPGSITAHVYYQIGNNLISDNGIEVVALATGQTDTGPVVTSVTPGQVVVGQTMTFTVTGYNLTGGMGFTVGDCAPSSNELPGGTSTQRQYQCTQQGSAGSKQGLVKDQPGGTVLYSFNTDAVNPSISSISPLVSTLGSPTVFTVKGVNLIDGMGFTVGDCEHSSIELEGGTASQRQFVCTQYGDPGVKRGLIKNKPGGNLLKEFEVQARLINVPQVFINTNDTIFGNGDALRISVSTSVDASETVTIDGETFDVTIPANEVPYKIYLRFQIPNGGAEPITLYQTMTGFSAIAEPFYTGVLPGLEEWRDVFSFTFSAGAPAGDYVLSVMAEDDLGQMVARDHAQFKYDPNRSARAASKSTEDTAFVSSDYPLTQVGQARREVRASTQPELRCQSKSLLKILDIQDKTKQDYFIPIEDALRKSVQVLRMGSSFKLEDRLQKLYGTVEGPMNIISKGEKLCEQQEQIAGLVNAYQTNLNRAMGYNLGQLKYGLRAGEEEAVNAMFAIDFLSVLYGFSSRAGVSLANFPTDQLKDAVLTVYNHQDANNTLSAVFNNGNVSDVELKFKQTMKSNGNYTTPIKLTVTATPVFTLEGSFDGEGNYDDFTKTYTTGWEDARDRTIDLTTEKTVKSHAPWNPLYTPNVLTIGSIKAGLYLITAKSASGDEVFRSTVYLYKDEQTETILIDR